MLILSVWDFFTCLAIVWKDIAHHSPKIFFINVKLHKFINFGWHTPFFLSSPPLFEFLVSSSSCTCSFLLYPCILQNMLHMYSEGSPYSKYIAVFCIAAMGMSTQYVILPLTYLPHYFSAIFLPTNELRTQDG